MTAAERRPLLTVRQVAEQLSLDEWSVRRLIRRRELPALNLSPGTRPVYRVEPEALEAFLESRRVAPLPQHRAQR